VAAFLVIQLTLPSPALGEIVVVGEPSPAGKTLRLIADGAASAAAIAPQIVEAAQKAHWYPMPRLLDVLDAYSREGGAEAAEVSAAFLLAEEHAATPVSRESIEEAAEQLRVRLKNRAENVTRRPGWYEYPKDLPLDVPLTKTSQAEWGIPIFDARTAHVLEQHLPRHDRREYVRLGFEAFLATTCEEFLDGKVASTCREVGVWPLRVRILQLAFGGLASDGTDSSVAELYLSQDGKTLDEMLEHAETIHPGGFSRQCQIIRRWRERAPSRWQVWADLEPSI
jgi:hypothetical protein